MRPIYYVRYSMNWKWTVEKARLFFKVLSQKVTYEIVNGWFQVFHIPLLAIFFKFWKFVFDYFLSSLCEIKSNQGLKVNIWLLKKCWNVTCNWDRNWLRNFLSSSNFFCSAFAPSYMSCNVRFWISFLSVISTVRSKKI